jgi:MerR family transcriptional regulator, thiopeptide resistance regulator
MLTIGDIAKATGVSVRRLHHYDKLGLLKPSARSDAKYRLYAPEDLIRLQLIVTLKQMGFTLAQIRVILADKASNMQSNLEKQLSLLQSQLSQHQLIYDRVKAVYQLAMSSGDLSPDNIHNTMETIKMLETYYTDEQRQQLMARDLYQDPKASAEFSARWAAVFAGLEDLQKAGIEAKDPLTKRYIDQAVELVGIFTDGDKGIEDSLNKMYETEGGASLLRKHGLDISDELYGYYEIAFDTHGPSA